MIYRNIATGDNAIFLVTLAIVIKTPNDASQKIFFNEISTDAKKVKLLFEKWMKKWMRQELLKFCHQRRIALQSVGMLSLQMIDRLNKIETVAKSNTDHLTLCQSIQNIQTDIRLLIPSQNSRYRKWNSVMEEIIHYAHSQVSQDNEKKYAYTN